MPSVEVRPFHRRDREQLTGLLNAHAAAVVPGMGVSVATVLSQLEREPGEFIVDPWVDERRTLVAEQTYACLDGQDGTGQSYDGYRAFLSAVGFIELTQTRRVWTRTPGS